MPRLVGGCGSWHNKHQAAKRLAARIIFRSLIKLKWDINIHQLTKICEIMIVEA